MRGRRYTPAERLRMARRAEVMLEAGASYTEIGKSMGVPRDTIYYMVHVLKKKGETGLQHIGAKSHGARDGVKKRRRRSGMGLSAGGVQSFARGRDYRTDPIKEHVYESAALLLEGRRPITLTEKEDALREALENAKYIHLTPCGHLERVDQPEQTEETEASE